MKNNVIILFLNILLWHFVLSSNLSFASPSQEKTDIELVKTSTPRLEVKTLGGVNFNLQKSKNKLTIVNFWAYWCNICKAELQILENIYQKYQNYDIEIIGISIDEKIKIKEVNKTINKLSFKNAIFEDIKTTDFQRPSTIPQTVIFDNNHKIIDIYEGELEQKEIEKMIDKYVLGQ